jgi:hypothetical protein
VICMCPDPRSIVDPPNQRAICGACGGIAFPSRTEWMDKLRRMQAALQKLRDWIDNTHNDGRNPIDDELERMVDFIKSTLHAAPRAEAQPSKEASHAE